MTGPVIRLLSVQVVRPKAGTSCFSALDSSRFSKQARNPTAHATLKSYSPNACEPKHMHMAVDPDVLPFEGC